MEAFVEDIPEISVFAASSTTDNTPAALHSAPEHTRKVFDADSADTEVLEDLEMNDTPPNT